MVHHGQRGIEHERGWTGMRSVSIRGSLQQHGPRHLQHAASSTPQPLPPDCNASCSTTQWHRLHHSALSPGALDCRWWRPRQGFARSDGWRQAWFATTWGSRSTPWGTWSTHMGYGSPQQRVAASMVRQSNIPRVCCCGSAVQRRRCARQVSAFSALAPVQRVRIAQLLQVELKARLGHPASRRALSGRLRTLRVPRTALACSRRGVRRAPRERLRFRVRFRSAGGLRRARCLLHKAGAPRRSSRSSTAASPCAYVRRRGRAPPRSSCARTGGSPCRMCARTGGSPCRICTGTGLTPLASTRWRVLGSARTTR